MTKHIKYELLDGRVFDVPYNRYYVAPVTKKLIEEIIDELNTSFEQSKILENIKENYAHKMLEQYQQGRADAISELKEKYLDADSYNEGLADGKADAIDEIIKKIEFEEKWLFDCNVFDTNVTISFEALKSFAEQLKEQSDE